MVGCGARQNVCDLFKNNIQPEKNLAVINKILRAIELLSNE